jgi:hypothetical protein
MSWQAVELIRDHSRSSGMTRLVAMVLASYANEKEEPGNPYGGAYPSIDTVRVGTGAEPVKNSKNRKELRGGCSAKTVVSARRWLIEHGEAEITGSKPSRTGSRVPILSFTPLLQRSKAETTSEDTDSRAPARVTSDLDSDSGFPFPSVSGYLGKPFDDPGETLQGLPEETLSLPPGNPSNPKGYLGKPFDGGECSLAQPSGSGLSVASVGPTKATKAQRAAEAEDVREQLSETEALLEQRPDDRLLAANKVELEADLAALDVVEDEGVAA